MENRELYIPILSGSAFNLELFDFSFKGIKIIDVQSAGFEQYIEKNANNVSGYKVETYLDLITKNIDSSFEKKYAIVKENPTVDYNYGDIYNVWKLLLIIFPSDLQIEHIIHLFYEKGQVYTSSLSSWDRYRTGDYPGDFLISLEEDVPEINEFSKLVFDKLNLQNYIGISIENYTGSYRASHFHYQYLALCIALECLIPGNQELSYRLKRNVALLCGKEISNCDILFDNLKIIYDLRSSIVHGDDFKMEKVVKFLPVLKSIVSRTLIELLIHNIKDNKTLNNIITKLAFGDRNKISGNWKYYKLNVITEMNTNYKPLDEKYFEALKNKQG